MEQQFGVTVTFDNYDGVLAKMHVTGENPNANREVLRYTLTTLTYYDKSRKYTWAAKHGYDDCLVKFFDGRNRTLPIGLIPRLSHYLRDAFQGQVSVKITRAIREMFTPPFGPVPIETVREFEKTLNMYDRGKFLEKSAENPALQKGDFSLKMFEHQEKIVLEALNRRRVSILACTSSGKSMSMMVIARYLMERENKKVLVIVPNAALVKQLFRNFRDDYGWEEAGDYCTQIYGGSADKVSKKKLEELKRLSIGEEATLKQITISTWQSLRLKDDSYFKVFTAVLVDEAHSAKGEELRNILAKCVNANNFKVGFSGTLPDAELANDNVSNHIDAGYIEGGLGPKLDVVRLKELIAKGILTPLEVKAIFVPYPMPLRPAICADKTRYEDERAIVCENSSRKDVVDMLFTGGRITGEQNTVILFNYKEHLHEFCAFMKEKHPGYTYHVVEGDVGIDDRDDISLAMEKCTGNVLIATYGCMKQGVNIKLLHNLILAEPMKSAYTIVQSLGRIVRRHPDKKLATTYDIVDDAAYYTNPRNGGPGTRKYNYMMKHYYERVKYYANEELPIEEIHLDGLYEAQVTPDDIKKRREKAAATAAKQQAKGQGRTSRATWQRTMFTR